MPKIEDPFGCKPRTIVKYGNRNTLKILYSMYALIETSASNSPEQDDQHRQCKNLTM